MFTLGKGQAGLGLALGFGVNGIREARTRRDISRLECLSGRIVYPTGGDP